MSTRDLHTFYLLLLRYGCQYYLDNRKQVVYSWTDSDGYSTSKFNGLINKWVIRSVVAND